MQRSKIVYPVPPSTNRSTTIIAVDADLERSLYIAQLYELPDAPLREVAREMAKTATFIERGFAWTYLNTEGTKVNGVDMDGYFVLRGDGDRIADLTKLVRDSAHDKEPIDQFKEEKEHERKVRIVSSTDQLTLGVYDKRLGGAYISITGSQTHEEATCIAARWVLEAPQVRNASLGGSRGIGWKP